MRALQLALLLSSLASLAHAQSWDRSRAAPAAALDDEVAEPASETSTGIGPSTLVSDPVEPRPRAPRARRDHAVPMIAGGAVLLAVGYGASAAWSGYYFDSLHLGPQGCNDQYAGWHLLPIVGPVVGMLAGGACIPDGLHLEEAVLPVLFSLAQIAGLVLTIFGAQLEDQRSHAPRVALAIDPSGGFASLAWSL